MLKATRRNTATWDNARWSVLLVDDHPIMRASIRNVLAQSAKIQKVEEAESAKDALAKLEERAYDLTVIDLSLKGASGLTLLQAIRMRDENSRTLIMSMYADPFHIDAAIEFGANGYVTKWEPLANMLTAVQQILKGQSYFSQQVESHLERRLPSRAQSARLMPEACLTSRELEVLRWIGSGHSSSEIAQEMSLSVKTVHTHTEHIKRKLHLEHPSRLRFYAAFWMQEGTTGDRAAETVVKPMAEDQV